MLRALARSCFRHRRLVIAAWLAALVALVGLSRAAGGTFEDVFRLPGSESQATLDLLTEGGFGTRSGFQGQLVIRSAAGIADPTTRDVVTEVLDAIRANVPDIAIASPYDPAGRVQVSPDGTIAFAELGLSDRSEAEYATALAEIRSRVQAARAAGVELELGGDRFAASADGASEGVGFLAAMVILVVAFGSLLAMGLPIATALAGIGTGTAVVALLANVVTMPSFTIQLVLMLSIGVGIDYALFIVTRYRQALAVGAEPAAAVEMAMSTAGRAVLFAGTTVVVSVLGLLVTGLDINRALGIAAAAGVTMTMLASLTLLPASLGFVGRRIDRFGLPHRHQGDDGGGAWYRWSRYIQRRPLVPGLVALAIMIVLAAPALSMRLGLADAGNRPTADTTRRAYDLLAEGFGAGANGPLFLAAQVPDAAAASALDRLVGALRDVDGVAASTPAIRNEAGTVALVQVFPTTAPQDDATSSLVHRLRDEIVPATTAGTTLVVHVGGSTAAAVDFADLTAERLPLLFAMVLGLSFLVLLVVFRSVLVPVAAAAMNVLSIGAAYGVAVAVFQWGWGAGLLGVEPGPIEAWAPMMLFAIVFGLSMDYEVFLLSRIREEYDRTGDNGAAVANGLAASARVITAAAAIMVVVFAGFVLSPSRSLQLFGLGLAMAVLVDATLIRLVLVPAVMALAGARNWWLPPWLDRLLPVLHVEATSAPQ
jgi:RND superfamily putative drug exporter